jgi:hypothetical protein
MNRGRLVPARRMQMIAARDVERITQAGEPIYRNQIGGSRSASWNKCGGGERADTSSTWAPGTSHAYSIEERRRTPEGGGNDPCRRGSAGTIGSSPSPKDCGFSSVEQMRRAFVRILRIPQREYRKCFASSAIRESWQWVIGLGRRTGIRTAAL